MPLDAVLDVAVSALRPIAAQLTPWGLHSLRATCSALRHHPDLLGAVTAVHSEGVQPGTSLDRAFLLRLSNLRRLTLEGPPGLAGFRRLATLNIVALTLRDEECWNMDLRALRGLPRLRSLTLHNVDHYDGLVSLTALTHVALDLTPACEDLTRLTSLRALALGDAEYLPEHLPQLSRLQLRECEPVKADAALRLIAQMPAMRVLELWDCVSTPRLLLRLTQLTSLCLFCYDDGVYEVLPFLPTLVQLGRLGLHDLDPGRLAALASPSLTSLYVAYFGDAPAVQLSCLRQLPSLRLLQLYLAGKGDLLLAADRLPEHAVEVELYKWPEGRPRGRLYIDTDCRVQHRYVGRLSFDEAE